MEIKKIEKLIQKEENRKAKLEKEKQDKSKHYEEKLSRFREALQKEKEEKLKTITEDIKFSDKKLTELKRLHEVLLKADEDLKDLGCL